MMAALLFFSHASVANPTGDQASPAANQIASDIASNLETSVESDGQTSAANAEAWLHSMARAVKQLNYQLSLIMVVPGKDAQPYLWRHARKDDGTVVEQLSLLNGPGTETVRINDKVGYFEPYFPAYSLQSEQITSAIPIVFFRDPIALAPAYEFIHVGRNRIAGRAAQHVRIVSRDKSRHSLNLWIDQQTGLPLKFEMVNARGQWLEQVQVTNIALTEDSDSLVGHLVPTNLPPVVKASSNQRIAAKWSFAGLPVGMHLVRTDRYALRKVPGPVDYLMLSDGVVDVSIYIRALARAEAGYEVLASQDANTVLSRTRKNHQITVIGKLPAQTANAIVASLQFN